MPSVVFKLEQFSDISDFERVSTLTQFLHKAYKPLADAGFRAISTYQDDEKTKERIQKGECWMATVNDELIGTILYRQPGNAGGNFWYLNPFVASIGQFAVKEQFQKQGIGAKLIEHTIGLALRDGAHELALDTAEGALYLVNYYSKLGFRHIGYCQWQHTNYRSVILSKQLKEPPPVQD